MRHRYSSSLKELTSISLSITILLTVWEAAFRLGLYKSPFVPPPSAIGSAFMEMARTRELFTDVAASLQRAFGGFAVGSILGIVAGIVTGRISIVDRTLGGLIRAMRSIPAIALVPLAIVWFGLGETGKIALVAWGVFFPVWINSHIGATRVPIPVIWAARSLGASRFRLLYEVILPSALPFVIAGMRTGMATAFVVLVAAEMAGAFGGVGYRIYVAHLTSQVDKMMADIILLGVLGAMSDLIFAAAISSLPWTGGEEEHE
jgi:ABC-type nitrate/sulfonate/bicarbonate transport system permease component